MTMNIDLNKREALRISIRAFVKRIIDQHANNILLEW